VEVKGDVGNDVAWNVKVDASGGVAGTGAESLVLTWDGECGGEAVLSCVIQNKQANNKRIYFFLDFWQKIDEGLTIKF
jgi:hypothetical protein